MSFWTIIIFGGVLLVIFAVLGHKLSVSAGKKAGKIFRALEIKYADFVEQYLSNAIINDQTVDKEDAIKDIMTVIKPDIDGIIAHINSTDLSDINVRYATQYFQNAIRISEGLYDKRNKHRDRPVTDKDREKLYEAFKDAVNADLTRRLLSLASGKL